MAGHVKRIQAPGMKYMVWFAVPPLCTLSGRTDHGLPPAWLTPSLLTSVVCEPNQLGLLSCGLNALDCGLECLSLLDPRPLGKAFLGAAELGECLQLRQHALRMGPIRLQHRHNLHNAFLAAPLLLIARVLGQQRDGLLDAVRGEQLEPGIANAGREHDSAG